MTGALSYLWTERWDADEAFRRAWADAIEVNRRYVAASSPVE